MQIDKKTFKIIAKPNSSKNEIVRFDNEKQAYIINIKAKPENNKANIEIIKFLSRALKKKVRIASGTKSREKFIEIVG